MKDKSKSTYRTKKTYLQVDSGSTNLSRVEKFDKLGKPIETIGYSYNKKNNENKISFIWKFNTYGKHIESINYSEQNDLVKSIVRVFYDSLNRAIIYKEMSFESNKSGLKVVDCSYNHNNLIEEEVQIENYPADTTITNYKYDFKNRLIETRIKHKFKDKFGFTIENVYENDSLTKKYSYEENGLNRHLTDSIVYLKDNKIIYKLFPRKEYDKQTFYYENNLITKEISESMEIYYTYNKQKYLIRKEMILHHNGGMLDLPSPSQKYIYTYIYE